MNPLDEGLLYEFGVLQGVANSSSYKARQLYSPFASAVLVGLPVGDVQLYVCVRAARQAAGKDGVTAVGPRACATVSVTTNSQATAEQVQGQLNQLASMANGSNKPTTSEALDNVQRLSAIRAVSNASDATSTAAIRSLAAGLLSQLLAPSSSDQAAASVPTLTIYDSVSTAWSMADDKGRAAVLQSTGNLASRLANQAMTPADAAPVVTLLANIAGGAASLLTALTSNATGEAVSMKDAARQVLNAMTEGMAGLSSGLLGGATLGGDPVSVVTDSFAVTVKRSDAAGLATGATTTAATPAGATASSPALSHRRALRYTATNTSSPVAVALSPAVSTLCTAEPTCATAGVGLTLTVLADTTMLLTSLGGSAAVLASGVTDYKQGGAVSVISPIIHVGASGLPASAASLTDLLNLQLPVDLAAVAAGGSTARRAVIRLQDFGAAAADASMSISAANSTTRTLSPGSTTSADLVLGASNKLGDFVVIQYQSTAVDQSSNASSPPPAAATPGASGPALLPSSLLVSALAGIVAVAMAVMA